tara:strand:+ start:916 stop:1104 length:189 start_codon:yes stop_codon:yes gene_type:complete
MIMKDYVTAKERLNFKGKSWKCNVIVKNMSVKIQQIICTIMTGHRQKTIAAKNVQSLVMRNR